LFGYETVGVQDDFFEMGGDSLKAMIVSARLHKELKKKIPIAAFFNEPTIEGLVRYFGTETGPERHAPIPVAAEKDYYPLAPVQEPLFYQSMKNPENTALNIVMCFRLAGEFEIGQIEQAFGKMIERHEIYRASFWLEEGRPVQRIQAGVEFRVERIEKPGATEEQLQEAVHALVKPFDLRKAPLFKVAAISTGDGSD
ncbi:MAG: hypothetical protein GY765_12595, partial [bacterium]|nr:hypothetical protein [bacterium]